MINNGNSSERIDLPLADFHFDEGTRFVDELNGGEFAVKDGRLSIYLDAISGAILVSQ